MGFTASFIRDEPDIISGVLNHQKLFVKSSRHHRNMKRCFLGRFSQIIDICYDFQFSRWFLNNFKL